MKREIGERELCELLFGQIKTDRSEFDEDWRDIAEHIQPRRGRFNVTDRNRIQNRKHAKIINSKATKALSIAQSGIHAGIMSPARPWFSFETPDTDMMERQTVLQWLQFVEKKMRQVFNGGNLYDMAPTMIGEGVLFGTGCMLQEEDYDDVLRFYTQTIGSYYLGQDAKLRINMLGREFSMTVYSMVGEYGYDNVSATVRNLYDRGNYNEWVEIRSLVMPNEAYNSSKKMGRFKKFISKTWEPGNPERNKFLRIGGHDRFPAYCPRYETTNEDIYGTNCPGMMTLGDVKQLQHQEKRKAQGIDKMVNPPMNGPAELRNYPVSTLPGGVNLYNGEKKFEPLYLVNPQINEMRMDIRDVENRIQENFMVDLFMAITNMQGIQPKNEMELSARQSEKLLQLGPALERWNGEFLNGLIDSTFDRCFKAGMFPPPPPELIGVPLRIEYISSLAMAQRTVSAGSVERMTGYATSLLQAGFDQVNDKFDVDQALDEYQQAIGAPARMIRPDDVVAKNREQNAKMQQAAQMVELAQGAGKAAQGFASAGADMGGGK